MRTASTIPVIAILAALPLFSPRVSRAEVGAGAKLAAMRVEVDGLEAQLEDIRVQARAEQLSLQAQRRDLEVMLRSETVRRETLLRLRARLKQEQRHADASSEELRKPGLAAATDLHDYIRESLPYQREARLAAVTQIVVDLKRHDVDLVLTISKLWQLYEDEIRLTEEVGLHRQAVDIDGQRHLAEVARLGMAVLYFRLNDGRVGWAIGRKSGYAFEVLTQPQQQRAISSLYDALRKQIRQGAFELPLPKPRPK